MSAWFLAYIIVGLDNKSLTGRGGGPDYGDRGMILVEYSEGASPPWEQYY